MHGSLRPVDRDVVKRPVVAWAPGSGNRNLAFCVQVHGTAASTQVRSDLISCLGFLEIAREITGT